MSAAKIDVRTTGGPFNLGLAKNWSKKDLEFLIANGAVVNHVGYLHIPLDQIEGEVLLGIGQRQAKGESPPKLFVGGLEIDTGKFGRGARVGH